MSPVALIRSCRRPLMRGGEEEGSGGEGFSRQVAAGKVFLSLERTTTSDLSFLPGRWPSLRCFKPSCHLCCRALLLRRCRRRRRPASGVRRLLNVFLVDLTDFFLSSTVSLNERKERIENKYNFSFFLYEIRTVDSVGRAFVHQFRVCEFDPQL